MSLSHLSTDTDKGCGGKIMPIYDHGKPWQFTT